MQADMMVIYRLRKGILLRSPFQATSAVPDKTTIFLAVIPNFYGALEPKTS